jgi:hypothetical protein
MDRAPDVADLVQQLRMLIWQSSRPLRDAVGDECWQLLLMLEWRRPDSLRAISERLQPSYSELADEWSFLADAFASGPRMPNIDDLLRSYVRGDIGDRTVKWTMDWDHWQLIDACIEHGLPFIQMGEDWDE